MSEMSIKLRHSDENDKNSNDSDCHLVEMPIIMNPTVRNGSESSTGVLDQQNGTSQTNRLHSNDIEKADRKGQIHNEDDEEPSNPSNGEDEHTNEDPLYGTHSPDLQPSPQQHQGAQNNVKIIRVVPLPHARSEVWSYFGFIADDDGEIHDKRKTICRICATTLSYSGNTTNLFTHLKAMHPEVTPQKIAPTNRSTSQASQQQQRTIPKSLRKRKYFEESSTTNECITVMPADSPCSGNGVVFGMRQTLQCGSAPIYDNEVDVIEHKSTSNNNNSSSLHTISITNNNNNNNNSNNNHHHHQHHNSSTSSSQTLVKCKQPSNTAENQVIGNSREEEITNALANFIAKDCRPLGILNGKGFEELIRTLAPGYQIPDAARMEPLVRKKYHDIRYNMFMRSIDSDNDFLL